MILRVCFLRLHTARRVNENAVILWKTLDTRQKKKGGGGLILEPPHPCLLLKFPRLFGEDVCRDSTEITALPLSNKRLLRAVLAPLGGCPEAHDEQANIHVTSSVQQVAMTSARVLRCSASRLSHFDEQLWPRMGSLRLDSRIKKLMLYHTMDKKYSPRFLEI